jgi:hypothetical protein
MKKWWLALFLLFFLSLSLSSVSFAKDCLECNLGDVFLFTGCNSYCAVSSCSGSSLSADCDASECMSCKDDVGGPGCRSDCSAAEVCQSGACCRPAGRFCVSASQCCSGDCCGYQCLDSKKADGVSCFWDCECQSGDCRIAGFGKKCYSSCVESWQCSSWSTCSGGTQARSCADLNSCGTVVSKPATTQPCSDSCNGCVQGGVCQSGTANNMCGLNGVDCVACAAPNSVCSNGVCIPAVKSDSCDPSSFSFQILNKLSLYEIGDSITTSWSALPSCACDPARSCTVEWFVNGDRDFYVSCGDPGVASCGGIQSETGILSAVHCYGRTGSVTNNIQMFVKDSSGSSLASSNVDGYTLDCGPSCKNAGEACAAQSDCCAGAHCNNSACACDFGACPTGGAYKCMASNLDPLFEQSMKCAGGCWILAENCGLSGSCASGSGRCLATSCEGFCSSVPCSDYFGCSQASGDCASGYCCSGNCSSLISSDYAFCRAADSAGTCSRLGWFSSINQSQCCSSYEFCCENPIPVSLTEFSQVLVDVLSDHFSGNSTLNSRELMDLFIAYSSAHDNAVDLSGKGRYSGEKLIDIYNKAKGSPQLWTCSDYGGMCKQDSCSSYDSCFSAWPLFFWFLLFWFLLC